MSKANELLNIINTRQVNESIDFSSLPGRVSWRDFKISHPNVAKAITSVVRQADSKLVSVYIHKDPKVIGGATLSFSWGPSNSYEAVMYENKLSISQVKFVGFSSPISEN